MNPEPAQRLNLRSGINVLKNLLGKSRPTGQGSHVVRQACSKPPRKLLAGQTDAEASGMEHQRYRRFFPGAFSSPAAAEPAVIQRISVYRRSQSLAVNSELVGPSGFRREQHGAESPGGYAGFRRAPGQFAVAAFGVLSGSGQRCPGKVFCRALRKSAARGRHVALPGM